VRRVSEVYRWDWKSLELQNARLSDVPMNLYQSAFRMRQVREASLYRAQNSGPPVQNVGFLASFRAIRAFEVPDGRAPLVPLYQLSFDSGSSRSLMQAPPRLSLLSFMS
jgi:hypothetical protein